MRAITNWFRPDLPPGWNHSFAVGRHLMRRATFFRPDHFIAVWSRTSPRCFRVNNNSSVQCRGSSDAYHPFHHAAVATIAIATGRRIVVRTDRGRRGRTKPQSYKPVAIELPQPVKDPSFATFRKQIADDRANARTAPRSPSMSRAASSGPTDDGKDIALARHAPASTTWRARSTSTIPTPKAGTCSRRLRRMRPPIRRRNARA